MLLAPVEAIRSRVRHKLPFYFCLVYALIPPGILNEPI